MTQKASSRHTRIRVVHNIITTVAADPRNAVTVGSRHSLARGIRCCGERIVVCRRSSSSSSIVERETRRAWHTLQLLWRTHCGVPALVVIVVDRGTRDPTSLAHPTAVVANALWCAGARRHRRRSWNARRDELGTPYSYCCGERIVVCRRSSSSSSIVEREARRAWHTLQLLLWGTHCGVPALVVIVVDCGTRDPTSLAHPTATATTATAVVANALWCAGARRHRCRSWNARPDELGTPYSYWRHHRTHAAERPVLALVRQAELW